MESQKIKKDIIENSIKYKYINILLDIFKEDIDVFNDVCNYYELDPEELMYFINKPSSKKITPAILDEMTSYAINKIYSKKLSINNKKTF